jgi:hypothetical protein
MLTSVCSAYETKSGFKVVAQYQTILHIILCLHLTQKEYIAIQLRDKSYKINRQTDIVQQGDKQSDKIV